MKRSVVVLVLVAVIVGTAGLIYMQWPAKRISDGDGTGASGMPTIETTVSIGIASGDQSGGLAGDAFETIRDTAPELTEQQVSELADALTLVIIMPKQKLAQDEKPVMRAFLRNDSEHHALFLRGSKHSAAGQFPVFNWKVKRTDGDAVATAASEETAPVQQRQFGVLRPGDVLDLGVEKVWWPFASAMKRAGTYLIQLEYSTDPAHVQNDAVFYEEFKRQYPELHSKMPAVTVESNVVSVSVAE